MSKLLLKPKPVNWAEKDKEMRFLWGEDREEGGLGRAGPRGVLLAGGPRKEAADTEGPRLHFVP